MKKIEKENFKCKFYNAYDKTCVHKDNIDIRSRKTNGQLRKFPKRCEKKFCPLTILETLHKNKIRGGKKKNG